MSVWLIEIISIRMFFLYESSERKLKLKLYSNNEMKVAAYINNDRQIANFHSTRGIDTAIVDISQTVVIINWGKIGRRHHNDESHFIGCIVRIDCFMWSYGIRS